MYMVPKMFFFFSFYRASTSKRMSDSFSKLSEISYKSLRRGKRERKVRGRAGSSGGGGGGPNWIKLTRSQGHSACHRSQRMSQIFYFAQITYDHTRSQTIQLQLPQITDLFSAFAQIRVFKKAQLQGSLSEIYLCPCSLPHLLSSPEPKAHW